MNKTVSKTIFILVFFLIFVVVFSWIYFGVNPGSMAKYFLAQVGSTIGVSVSVPPNPFNQLAQQLKEKEKFLLEKEKAFEQKEAGLEEGNIFTKKNRSLILVVSGGILLVLILIILNFYFDYRYRRKGK